MKSVSLSDNIRLSAFTFGTTKIGTANDEASSFRLFDRYYAGGGRSIDTARIYGAFNRENRSLSEETVGKWVESRGVRNEVTLITKGCHAFAEEMKNGTPEEIRAGVPKRTRVNAPCIAEDIEHSLRTLRTDRIDHWMLHRDNASVPVSELLDMLEHQLEKGNILSYGASNWTTARLDEAAAYAKAHGYHGFLSSQINYCLAKPNDAMITMDATEYLGSHNVAWYQKSKLPVLAWSVLASGYLTTMASGHPEKCSDFARDTFKTETTDRRIEAVLKLCRESGRKPLDYFLASVLQGPVPGIVLATATKEDHVDELIKSAEAVIPQEEIDRLYQI